MLSLYGDLSIILPIVNPKRQHTIPKSYLENFSDARLKRGRKKRQLEVHLKSQQKLVPRTSIDNVCVNSEFYSLTGVSDTDRYGIELFYAECVDADFPEVYELLLNKQLGSINEEQKRKIVKCYTSLFFRTPKQLKAFSKFNLSEIEKLPKEFDSKKGKVKIEYKGESIVFDCFNHADYEQQIKDFTRNGYLAGHLIVWYSFFNHHLRFSSLHVLEFQSDTDLITSDNPVVLANPEEFDQPINVFNPKNQLSVHLDRKHALQIRPITNTQNPSVITRQVIDQRAVADGFNQIMVRSAEDQVVGFPGTVKAYLNRIDLHNGQLTVAEASERLLKGIYNLKKLVNQYGTVDHPKVILIVRHMRNASSLYEGDGFVNEVIAKLEKLGHRTRF